MKKSILLLTAILMFSCTTDSNSDDTVNNKDCYCDRIVTKEIITFDGITEIHLHTINDCNGRERVYLQPTEDNDITLNIGDCIKNYHPNSKLKINLNK